MKTIWNIPKILIVLLGSLLLIQVNIISQVDPEINNSSSSSETMKVTTKVENPTSSLSYASDKYLMKIYPNPAKNEFTLELSENIIDTPRNLFIYNIVGEMVEKIEIRQGKSNIDISGYKSGAYYLQLLLPSGRSETTRLVVK
ncbi:MAG: T9SS type A sorting domain-containing protein [Bacteroidales bacterium]|nr:T9SS type A sorting domain-containing protein [Bacteroidales bacterium]